jgi:hypothetical protein
MYFYRHDICEAVKSVIVQLQCQFLFYEGDAQVGSVPDSAQTGYSFYQFAFTKIALTRSYRNM